MEESAKARENGERYALMTAGNAAEGVQRRECSRAWRLRINCTVRIIELKSMQPGKSNDSIVVSALSARTGFGKLLRRVEDEHRSLVIEKRGTPRAVLLSIRDYVRLAAPEPEILRIIGEESKRKGTDKLTCRQIDQEIKAVRAAKRKRG
ncbi:MAG TPA: type II toxin-antitoxin system Phd/YefM family antitoxin [Bryobacteraceae bacterium]|nr:type II toxin-antitoxin system Phd/YefM family antitoxin [Bryobacteraceae bacterium]